jgi:hypothetical protein
MLPSQSFAQTVPFLEVEVTGWVYYVICAILFTIAGMICGYFIWKRGHMQMLDAEIEVKLTASELTALREDTQLEEKELIEKRESPET